MSTSQHMFTHTEVCTYMQMYTHTFVFSLLLYTQRAIEAVMCSISQIMFPLGFPLFPGHTSLLQQ